MNFKGVVGFLAILIVSVSGYAYRPEITEPLEWWQKTIIYQVYPRSYKDTDNDGVGDLKGIENKLDYIKSLGVETIWISPFYKSPMKDFGYDISDYKSVDPIFGTMDDFDTLAKSIKDKGLRLLLDYVPNHSSNQHPWFNMSRQRIDPYTDYYMWRDGKDGNSSVPPNNWIQMFGGSAWEWDTLRQQYYLHQFIPEQPDLNYRNPLIHQEVRSNWQFWLDKGIDGFRVDAHIHEYENIDMPDEPRSNDSSATPFDWTYLSHIYTTCQPEILDVLLEWRVLLDNYTKGDGNHRLMVTEGYCSPQQAMEYYGNATQELADFPFNFELQKINSSQTANEIYQQIDSWMKYLPSYAWPNFLVGNHDQRRVGSRMGPGNVDGINMLLLLIGGTPVIYNGDEFGMEDNMNISYKDSVDPYGCNYGPDHYLEHSRDPERTPLQWDANPGTGFTGDDVKPWLPIHANHVTLNVAAQENDTRSHLNTFRKLVTLRQEDSFFYGSIEFPLITDQLLSVSRVKSGSLGYLIAFNIADATTTVDLRSGGCCRNYTLPETGNVVIRSDKSARNEGDQVSLTALGLGANEALVISFQPVTKSDSRIGGMTYTH